MTENKAIELFKGLPKYARGIIAFIIVALIFYVLYLIYSAIKKAADNKNVKNTANAAGDLYQQELNKGQKLSLNALVYNSAANDIANKLEGCDSFDNEIKAIETIANVVKKPIDWYYLVKVFNVRSIDNCGLGNGDTTYALPELLKDQLDSSGVYRGSGALSVIGTGFTMNSRDLLMKYLYSIGVTL